MPSTHPTDEEINRCASTIARGGVVVVPTDTLYGLAASIGSAEAIARILAIKQRDIEAGMPVLLASAEQVSAVGEVVPYLDELGSAFWPGGLTLVIPALPTLEPGIPDGRRTVAGRVPGMAVTREFSRRTGVPITGTSANRHNDPPPTTANEARVCVGEVVDGLLDRGPVGGTASTIVDLTVDRPTILRSGAVPTDEIRQIVPDVIVPTTRSI